MSFTVDIDPNSGFCFGVIKAVEKAEKYLTENSQLYSLGDIVHNACEVERLEEMGLKSITTSQLNNLPADAVLFRAHGEPPTSYTIANQRNIKIVDATCPVVLKLQQRIRNAWGQLKAINGQILIYGKKGHPEVIGLMGQTNNEAILIENTNDLSLVDFSKPIELFSQTTKSIVGFHTLIEIIQNQMHLNVSFVYHDTICRQVANRAPLMAKFAATHDIIIFVGGAKSSNAQVLFNECLQHNSNSFFVNDSTGIQKQWINSQTKSVGVCGATSTPQWLLNSVAESIRSLNID